MGIDFDETTLVIVEWLQCPQTPATLPHPGRPTRDPIKGTLTSEPRPCGPTGMNVGLQGRPQYTTGTAAEEQ